MKCKLTIRKVGKTFEVDDLSRSGSSPVGRGNTLMSSIGNYFHNNQNYLGITFEVCESAQKTENRRRDRELKRR